MTSFTGGTCKNNLRRRRKQVLFRLVLAREKKDLRAWDVTMLHLESAVSGDSKTELRKLKTLRARVGYHGTYFHVVSGCSKSGSDQALERSYIANNSDMSTVSYSDCTYGSEDLKHDADTNSYLYATRRLRISRFLGREEHTAGTRNMTKFDETFSTLHTLAELERISCVNQLRKMARCQDDAFNERTERAILSSRLDTCTSFCVHGQYPPYEYNVIMTLQAPASRAVPIIGSNGQCGGFACSFSWK